MFMALRSYMPATAFIITQIIHEHVLNFLEGNIAPTSTPFILIRFTNKAIFENRSRIPKREMRVKIQNKCSQSWWRFFGFPELSSKTSCFLRQKVYRLSCEICSWKIEICTAQNFKRDTKLSYHSRSA